MADNEAHNEQSTWLDNLRSMRSTKEKSDDDFEKNLVLITSGTLVLSLTFIDKIAPLASTHWIAWLIIAWFLLATSLLLNLISHLVSSKNAARQFEKYALTGNEDELNKVIAKDNKSIDTINYWTVGLMISGIFCLIVYCSVNAYYMSKKTPEKNPMPADKPITNSKGPTGGRTTTFLAPSALPKPTPKPESDEKKKQ